MLCLGDLTIGHQGVPLINGISGEFPAGRVHLVLGRAGIGKSTFFSSLAGFLPALAGEMRWKDQAWVPAGRVGLAFQNPEMLFFCPTIGEEVTFALTQRGVAASEAEIRGRAWLARWGLAPELFWERHPLRLSGGEKRRVALAACSVFQPDLLLLDEPLAGLDRAGCRSLRGILEELSKDHVILVISHDPEPLLAIADRVLVFSEGRSRLFESASAFVRGALEDPEVFPLPDWYCLSMAGGQIPAHPPLPDPHAVFTFLREVGGFWSAGKGGQ